jgi:glycine cleavage system H protein
MHIDPQQLRYSPTHEWVHLTSDSQGQLAVIGISAFAVAELTDLVFMALPSVGQQLTAGEEFGEVESVKAVSPLYAPISGEVVEVHQELPNQLECLGTDPYSQGWMVKVRPSDPSQLEQLLSYEQYQKQCSDG